MCELTARECHECGAVKAPTISEEPSVQVITTHRSMSPFGPARQLRQNIKMSAIGCKTDLSRTRKSDGPARAESVEPR